MINLSKRLKKIADFVPANASVCDVGSDHGYLLIYLAQNKNIKKGLGVENKSGPFNILKTNLEKHNFTNINCVFSDGLDDVSDEYNAVVLAGMGYLNIKKILENNTHKIEYFDDIIVDSHNNIPELRKYIVSKGYYIEEEDIISENDIFYEIIHFKKGIKEYNEIEYTFGPKLLKAKNDIFIQKYRDLQNKYENILTNMPSNKKKEEIESFLKQITLILDN